MEAANNEGRFPVPINVGIALHHGDAAYGNVGSGQRLDFTVIGRDVNLASRIADLNKTLGEPLLMSKPFVEHLWGNPPRSVHSTSTASTRRSRSSAPDGFIADTVAERPHLPLQASTLG